MSFPKKITAYLHSNKESMYDLGKEIGLSEKSQKEFAYALYEVELELEVYENGRYKILRVIKG